MTWNTAVLRGLLSACALLLLLTGCGGGGGGGGDSSSNGRYSISLSTGTLTFSGAQYTTPPTQTVTATFKGDGVVVGTLPGQTLPPWLSVSNSGTGSGDRTDFTVQARPGGLAVGTYSATLRFASGSADGSNVVYRDLSVTMTVREGFSATPNRAEFTAIEGGSFAPAEGVTLQITGENVSWTVQAPTWVNVSATSGNTRGTIRVTPNMTGLAANRYQDWIRITDSVSGGQVMVLAVVQVTQPSLTISQLQFDVTIDSQTPDSALHHSIVISDTAQGQNAARAIPWSATSNSPLLTVAPPSGTSAGAPTTVTIDFDRNQLNGVRAGTLNPSAIISTSQYDNRYVRFTTNVNLPRANSALPYVLRSGTPANVTLFGENFTQDDIARLRLNDQPLSAFGASATRTNASEIALSLPALAAGAYDVSFQNQLGLRRSVATLKVASAPAPGPGEMVGTGNRIKLLFDAARSRLYAVDERYNELERYEWNGTQWNTLSSIAQSQIEDAALMRDGKQLVMSSRDGLRTVDLDTGAVALIPGTSFPNCTSTYGLYVAAPASGSLFATGHNSCGSLGEVRELDLLTGAVGGIVMPTYVESHYYDPMVASSGDGRVLAIGNTGSSGGAYGLFDLNTRTYIDRGDWWRYLHYYYYRMNLDYTGTKVLINHGYMRDRAGNAVGVLPVNAAATLSSDGNRAYIYVHGAGGTGHVEVLDVSTPVGANIYYPQIGANIPVPDDLGTPDPNYWDNYGSVTSFGMTLSADEQLLFIAGSTRIVAIDLP
ncbi:BACON domain-containing protein [Peristeroidobacter soli]|uniref:BACON domain-containing protein n=1 Tax=Peristeroidobacter soli TaxID=2497877 RepID=UPI00101B5F67|nr:BACON domain-containing protein [Peristeroidobacter soli]